MVASAEPMSVQVKWTCAVAFSDPSAWLPLHWDIKSWLNFDTFSKIEQSKVKDKKVNYMNHEQIGHRKSTVRFCTVIRKWDGHIKQNLFCSSKNGNWSKASS